MFDLLTSRMKERWKVRNGLGYRLRVIMLSFFIGQLDVERKL